MAHEEEYWCGGICRGLWPYEEVTQLKGVVIGVLSLQKTMSRPNRQVPLLGQNLWLYAQEEGVVAIASVSTQLTAPKWSIEVSLLKYCTSGSTCGEVTGSGSPDGAGEESSFRARSLTAGGDEGGDVSVSG